MARAAGRQQLFISSRSAGGTGSPEVMTRRVAERSRPCRFASSRNRRTKLGTPHSTVGRNAVDLLQRLAERMPDLEFGLRRAGEPVDHRNAGDHAGADHAEKRAGRKVGQRIEIGDAVVRLHALGLVAAPRLVPDRIGVVRGVVERRRLSAGGAGRIGDVPEHALGRREIVRQIGGLQAERLGIGDVVFLPRRRQRREIVDRTDLVRIDAVCPEMPFVERMRQRDRTQRPPQPLVLHSFDIRRTRLPSAPKDSAAIVAPASSIAATATLVRQTRIRAAAMSSQRHPVRQVFEQDLQ